MFSRELLKGTLRTIILKLLAEKGRMYGYEISQYVKTQSDGRLQLTEGALYPSLHKLEKEGLVKVEREQVGKRMRKYYSLTVAGEKASRSRLAEFEEFLQVMQLIIQPKTQGDGS
ncbi:MAG: PadR family transcriptional regulator [Bacteroidota bacterium]